MIGEIFMNGALVFLLVLLCINIVAFLAFRVDKRRAQRGEWRISEAALLSLAFFGGGLGAFLGMWFFHHKTRKWKFRILVPAFLFMQILLILLIIRYPI